ncbi:MAG: universal stress protein [Actinomycetota bacterium]
MDRSPSDSGVGGSGRRAVPSTIKVLVALDESAVSMRAAQEAVRLFSGRGVQFLVISVAREPVPWVPVGGFGLVSVPPPGWEDAARGLDETEITERATAAGANPAKVITDVGDAVECICAAAEEHDVDAVVVGGHDKGFLQRLLEPSVSAGVVRGTHRPVLVVSGTPPEKQRSSASFRAH